MPNTIRFLTMLIALVALSPDSHAQTELGSLEGVNPVKIVLGSLDEEARACGANEENIRSAASLPIATSRLRLSKAAPFVLQIRVTVLTFSGGSGCIATYSFHLWINDLVNLRTTNLVKIHKILLWGKSGVILGPKNGFERQIREAIEGLAKALVVDWTLDQQ